MNREQAEKLLAALIFNDLDETSKAELTAYLQSDDELRYRLADLRMAVKLADDAVNEGPDPVLGEQRLKQLKRLAKADRVKVWAFPVPRVLAVAAVLMFALVLLGLLMPSLSKTRRYAATTSSKSRPYARYLPPDKDSGSVAMGEVAATPPASRPATRGAPSKSPAPSTRTPAIGNYDVYFDGRRGSGMGGMAADRPVGRAGGVGGMGGMGMGGMASDKKDNSATSGMVGGMADTDGDMLAKQVTAAYGASERNRDMYAGVKIQNQQVAQSDGPSASRPDAGQLMSLAPSETFRGSLFRSLGRGSKSQGAQLPPTGMTSSQSSGVQIDKDSARQNVAGLPPELKASSPNAGPVDAVANNLGRGSTLQEQELKLAQTLRGRATVIVPQSSVSLGRGLSDKEADAGGGVYRGPRQEVAAETRGGANGVVNYHEGDLAYGWKGDITPQKPSVHISAGWTGEITPQQPPVPLPPPVPSAPAVADSKESDQVVTFKTPGNRTALLGDVPLVGELFRKGVQPKANVEAPAQPTGEITYPVPWGQVLEESGKLAPGLTESAVKAQAEQNAPSAGAMMFRGGAVGEETANGPSSSHFKVVPVNPWVMTDQDALSTFALDVDTASYALCRRYLRNGYLPPIGAVRMEEFINAFDYAYPQRDDQPFTVYAEGTPSPFAPVGQDLTLLKVAVKARTVGRDQRRAANLVFVVDASASMGQADRLPQVQAAANQLVDKLAEADRVSLITCANDARLHLEAVAARQKDTIHETINAIQPAGPTNLLAGLKLGYQMARKNFVAGQTNEVVLCSDGVANVGRTEAEAMLQEVAQDRKQAITLTCVGVGYGAYNDAFLEALANQGDGRYVFLDSSEQAQQALVGQLAASLENVASDARIQVQFNPNRVRRYRLIGYENRDIEDQRFRDDTVDAGAVGSGQCSTALYELELTASRGEGIPPSNRGQDARDTDGTDLGTVSVRYRNAETGQMEEISRPLADNLVRRRSVEEDPRFFLAAGAARFAEWLRQSEHAQNTALPEVQRLLDQVSAALPLDRDVQDLAALAHQAEGLPRAPEAAPAPEVQK